ncbi:MAG: hypothetical protein HFJ48_03235 [Clostridia bacterium]|nr:hypothetical protein [Clostridia bacterium]
MAEKERQRKQDDFATKHCTITTERYLITVFYYSNDWQSVRLYEKQGGKAKHRFHGTFAINPNEELEPYSFYIDNKDTEDGILGVTTLADYVYRIVHDTMRWLEFWPEAEMEDEDKDVAKFLNQAHSTGKVGSKN